MNDPMKRICLQVGREFIEGRLGPTPEEIAARTIKLLEEEAVHNAIAAFIGTDPRLHEHYNHRLAFKVTVDSFAQIMVAGVFGRAPMSEAEINKRIELVNAVPVVFPQGL